MDVDSQHIFTDMDTVDEDRGCSRDTEWAFVNGIPNSTLLAAELASGNCDSRNLVKLAIWYPGQVLLPPLPCTGSGRMYIYGLPLLLLVHTL